jgi:hypothetical protein
MSVCEKHEELNKQRKATQSDYSYFAYSQNKELRGMSDRQSKIQAKEAYRKLTEIGHLITAHKLNCEVCKKECLQL